MAKMNLNQRALEVNSKNKALAKLVIRRACG
jgi:hypothetical protein